MQIPLPAIALGISMKSISKHPSRRPVFRPKIMPFLCPENAPQKCKWLQCVRLVINKRQPLASLAGADQAHTLSQTNQPLNRPVPSHKRERATLPRRTTKSAAGSGAVPADPLGIGCRFSPPRARFSLYVCVIFVIFIRFKPPLCPLFRFISPCDFLLL